MPEAFFTIEGDGDEWYTPTDLARGPWDPAACHAGPPTGLLVRALERAVPALRLTRISVDLGRPAPMAGFRIATEVIRSGRVTANTRAAVIDRDGGVRITATGMHVGVSPGAVFGSTLDNTGDVTPKLDDASPGEFPIGRSVDGGIGFRDAVTVRYPAGEGPSTGPTTVWMRTVPLLAGEEPSPFQRISPLADCGNAFSRHADPDQVQFINTDLIIALHRDPVGEWLGSRVVSTWQPSGVGLADATLFDDDGPVGRALQTLLLRVVP